MRFSSIDLLPSLTKGNRRRRGEYVSHEEVRTIWLGIAWHKAVCKGGKILGIGQAKAPHSDRRAFYFMRSCVPALPTIAIFPTHVIKFLFPFPTSQLGNTDFQQKRGQNLVDMGSILFAIQIYDIFRRNPNPGNYSGQYSPPPAHAQLLPSILTRVQKCEIKMLWV